eukprot:8825422-Karenia_brevis.AAC.1
MDLPETKKQKKEFLTAEDFAKQMAEQNNLMMTMMKSLIDSQNNSQQLLMNSVIDKMSHLSAPRLPEVSGVPPTPLGPGSSQEDVRAGQESVGDEAMEVLDDTDKVMQRVVEEENKK